MSPGLSIAHYRITVKLGEGGMGEVWRATDMKLGREVAIKVLPESFAAEAGRLARFTREAQVLASLNHPNIAVIYGVEDRAIVMELVEGDHVRGPLPLETALNYAGQIADALEYAHDKGIVHRDLKPANIKITPSGQVKILDFGLAKFSDRIPSDQAATSPTVTAPATQAGVILGTPAYMAPEQACGQAVDRRADIWAFGVVFWEMLTGKRMSWKTAFALAVGAVVGASLRPTTTTPAALMRITEDPPVPLSIRGHGPAIALSPDGSRIVYHTTTQGGRTSLTIRRLDQGAPTDLPDTDNTDSMFFSSDSRWVGCMTNEGMFKVGVDGGGRTLLCKVCTQVRGVAWGGDGNLIYGSLAGPLFRVPASEGEPVQLTKLQDGELSHRWPTISPDGSVVVFASSRSEAHDEDDALTALSLRTGNRSDLHTPGTFPRFLRTGELLFMRAGSLYALPLNSGLRPAGAPRRLLTNVASVLRTAGSQFTLSDTGIAAYIPGYIDLEHLLLSWIGADGKLTPAAAPAAYVSPRLSPDGRQVAVRLDTPIGPDFHVLDLERGAMTRITFDAKAKSAGAVWTPDSRFLVFGGEAAGPGIYSVRSDGSAPPRKIMESSRGASPESFSRDGKWVLLAGAGKISAAPAAITTDGVSLGNTEALFEGNAPCFSPNGRWIVYQFYQSGTPHIFARRFHGAEAKYQISTGGGSNPVWPFAEQLFFTSNGGIATVKCGEQGESLRCDAPRQWSQQPMSRSPTRSFDVTGDGKVLALTPPIEASPAPARVNFLFNFSASTSQASAPQ